MGTLWGREPAVVIGLLGAAMNLVIAFGYHFTPNQLSAIGSFELALMGFIIRTQVTPVGSVPDTIDPTKLPRE